MKKYRTVIIGTGGIAHSHARAAKSLSSRIELTAALDIEASKAQVFAETHGIPGFYSDLETMLSAETPDLVMVASPPFTHAPISRLSLTAGAWVLCEKPLCASLAELDTIEEVERQTGRYCGSVFQWRYGAMARHLRDRMLGGEAGRLLVAQCQTLWYRDAAYYEVEWRGRWRTELGGPTMGHGIHAMDLFLSLAGPWASVKAEAATLDRKIEVEDVSMALLRMESGALASITNSILSPRQETYLRFDFQRLTAEVRHWYNYTGKNWTFTPADQEKDGKLAQAWSTLEEDDEATHESQVAAWIKYMDEGVRPSTSGSGARGTLELLSAIYKSSLTGETVERGTILPGDPFYESLHGNMEHRLRKHPSTLVPAPAENQ